MSRESIYKGVLAFRLENTKYVTQFIRHNDELLANCRNAGKAGLEKYCFEYARKHNDEFGNRFILELHDVFWDKVWSNINANAS